MMILDAIGKLLDNGGAMMYPLLLSSALLWFALGMRVLELNFFKRDEPFAVKKFKQFSALGLSAEEREALRSQCSMELERYGQLAFTIIALAPLLGLLGTVMGMIETFASLGSGQMYGASGGIAGGISSALLTTQMGLAVAIPGLMIARPLKKKEIDYKEKLVHL